MITLILLHSQKKKENGSSSFSPRYWLCFFVGNNLLTFLFTWITINYEQASVSSGQPFWSERSKIFYSLHWLVRYFSALSCCTIVLDSGQILNVKWELPHAELSSLVVPSSCFRLMFFKGKYNFAAAKTENMIAKRPNGRENKSAKRSKSTSIPEESENFALFERIPRDVAWEMIRYVPESVFKLRLVRFYVFSQIIYLKNNYSDLSNRQVLGGWILLTAASANPVNRETIANWFGGLAILFEIFK